MELCYKGERFFDAVKHSEITQFEIAPEYATHILQKLRDFQRCFTYPMLQNCRASLALVSNSHSKIHFVS